MAKYKLHPKSGVYDENGVHILPKKGNAAWEAYILWFRSGGIPDPPDVQPDPIPSLQEIKDLISIRVDQTAAVARMNFLTNISPAEMASWATKEKLAKEYISSNGASDPGVLGIEAQVRGISVLALAQKVLAKAEAYYQLEGIICGLNGKHNDIIKTLPTIEEVLRYDYQTGWPTP